MQVQNIQSTNFQAKPKVLPCRLSSSMQLLKNSMRNETVVIKSSDIERTINIRSLNINDGEAIFKDGKFLAKRDKNDKLVPYGSDTSLLEFGRTRIISKDNGEIIEYKKPFFKSWKKIITEAECFINDALLYYDDKRIVQKQLNKKDTLTESGKKNAERILDLFNSLNPFK